MWNDARWTFVASIQYAVEAMNSCRRSKTCASGLTHIVVADVRVENTSSGKDVTKAVWIALPVWQASAVKRKEKQQECESS